MSEQSMSFSISEIVTLLRLYRLIDFEPDDLAEVLAVDSVGVNVLDIVDYELNFPFVFTCSSKLIDLKKSNSL